MHEPQRIIRCPLVYIQFDAQRPLFPLSILSSSRSPDDEFLSAVSGCKFSKLSLYILSMLVPGNTVVVLPAHYWGGENDGEKFMDARDFVCGLIWGRCNAAHR